MLKIGSNINVNHCELCTACLTRTMKDDFMKLLEAFNKRGIHFAWKDRCDGLWMTERPWMEILLRLIFNYFISSFWNMFYRDFLVYTFLGKYKSQGSFSISCALNSGKDEFRSIQHQREKGAEKYRLPEVVRFPATNRRFTEMYENHSFPLHVPKKEQKLIEITILDFTTRVRIGFLTSVSLYIVSID